MPIDPAVASVPGASEPAAATRSKHPLRAKVIRASIWVLGGSYASQALRLASNLILTRLLFPEAFGLMVVVNVFTQLLQAFSDVGIGPSIIQNKRGEDPDFLNTAWTMQVARGFVLWFASCVIAAVLWYGQSSGWLVGDNVYAAPLLPALLPVAGLGAVISGFSATSLFTLNRRLALGRLTALQLGANTVGVIAMIGLALIYRNIWALVIGGLVGSAVGMFASHWLLPGIRNRFHWDRQTAGELYRFGRWIFLGTGLGFFAQKGDRFLFGALMSADVLGVLAIALLLARFVARVIARVGQRVLFPVYCRLAEAGVGELRRRFIKVRLVVLVVRTSVLAGLAVFGEDIIGLLWDARYEQAGWMLRILVAGALLKPEPLGAGVLLAFGDSFRRFVTVAAMAASKLITIAAGAYLAGVPGMIVGLAVASVPVYPVMAWSIKKYGVWLPGLDALQTAIGVAIVALAHWYQPLSFGPSG